MCIFVEQKTKQMKKLLFLSLMIMVGWGSAQSVDLDRHYVRVESIHLPSVFIEDINKRTYRVSTNVYELQRDDILNNIVIAGFKKVAENASIDIDVQIQPLSVNEIKISEKVHEVKDKDGKVKQRHYFYYGYMRYRTEGNVNVKNNVNGKEYSISLGEGGSYHSPEFKTRSEATEYMSVNRNNLVEKYQREFISKSIENVRSRLNNTYGYPIYNNPVLFWIMDSRRHPENDAHAAALEKIKNLLGKIKAEESIEVLKSELKPIEDYFLGVIPKYTGKKRAERKVRYASFYNLGKLYTVFEMPDKAIEMAKKLEENDYDKSDAKDIIEAAEDLKKRLEINKTKTKHFKIIKPE